jgi:hypothetical protein
MLVVMVMTASALLAIVMMVTMFVVMTAAALLVMVVMMFVVMVITAAALLAIVMMVTMFVVMAAAALLAIVMMVTMFVVVAAAALLVMMVVLMDQIGQLVGQGRLTFHSFHQLCTGKLIPGGGNQGGRGVVLTQQLHGSIQLLLGDGIRPGQNDGGSGFDLVIVELAKVLGVDFNLTGVSHGNCIAEGNFVVCNLLDSGNHIGQLAYTGGLDDYTVRMELGDDLLQSFAEIADERTADAAGVHFGDVDAGILQKAAVNANFTKFVFNEHQILTLVSLLDHFFDKGGFAGTKKAGIDIDFSHIYTFCIEFPPVL